MPGARNKRGRGDRQAVASDFDVLSAESKDYMMGAYDGPGDPQARRGRPESLAPASTRSSSRPGSQVRGASQIRAPLRDPARDEAPLVLLRNVDFGGNAYNIYDKVRTVKLLF